LLDHEKLLKALNDDRQACRESAQLNSPEEDQRNAVEFRTLTTHLMWGERKTMAGIRRHLVLPYASKR